MYRPSAGSAVATATGGGRAPLLKRDAIGSFEARLRWSARVRWLAPLAAAVVLGGAIVAWLLLSPRSDADAARARSEAMALVSLDDGASLEQAIARLDALLARSPGQRGAAADRALARVLRAAGLAEEGEHLSALAAARAAERDRLRRDQPPGWEEAERAGGAEARRLEADARASAERSRELAAAAAHALRRLQEEAGDDREVSRSLAAQLVLAGDRERAAAAIRAAREKAPADPWLDLAEGWLDLRDPSTRDRALVQLGALSAAHPELLRARYLLATAQAALGRRAEAVATLDAVLAANRRHEGARRLRDDLAARPALRPEPRSEAAAAPPSDAAPAPPPPPPAAKAPTQARKSVAQPAPAASATPASPDGRPAPVGLEGALVPTPVEPAAGEAPAPPTPAAVSPREPSPEPASPPAPRGLDLRRDRDPTSPLGDGG